MHWLCHNGIFLPENQPLFTAANRGFKYGDGLFETAKYYNGKLLLADLHLDRLFSGLKLLDMIPHFSRDALVALIAELCERNNCTALARVRMAAYRNEAGEASCVIEATALEGEKMQWNDRGWRLVLHPAVRKSCDAFANVKSANYLAYVMAGRYAAALGADECLVLNGHNRICDGSKTNLFLIRDGEVYTPALSEGPVAGVMRRAVMGFLKSYGYTVHEKPVMEKDVLQADAVFVTNAVEGLRWVRRFGETEYAYGVLKKLYADLFATIYT